MRAKLIKVLEHYHLYDRDKAIATTIVGNPMLLPNLSLKNCQEIECCVDLDTLVLSFYPKTEWDVEIKMICPHPEDTYVCGIQYGCDEDGCNHPNQAPLLDANGYLILKRIKE